jgi:hypothetical protein
LLGAVDSQLLDFVRVFATAVVTLAGISFRIFVGEDGAHSFQYRFGNEVFRGDQFETGGLALGFVTQEIGNFRIDGIERALHPDIGFGDHSVSSSFPAV